MVRCGSAANGKKGDLSTRLVERYRGTYDVSDLNDERGSVSEIVNKQERSLSSGISKTMNEIAQQGVALRSPLLEGRVVRLSAKPSNTSYTLLLYYTSFANEMGANHHAISLLLHIYKCVCIVRCVWSRIRV